MHLFKIALMVLATGFMMTCRDNKKSGTTKIFFRIHNARGFQAVLETIPYSNERREIIDSAIIESGDDIIEFKIPNLEERPFRIRIPAMRFQILLINDMREIHIEAGLLQPANFKVTNSPATEAVKNFMNEQVQLKTSLEETDTIIRRLKKNNPSPAIIDSLEKLNAIKLADYFERYKNFTDTTTSPGAFLHIYNHVDFGKDYTGLKNFITRAVQRFPGHSQILKLQEETLEYLKAFEEEYEVGQQLPDIQLNDTSGYPFSTAITKGKYVFLDIWASWCGPCLAYDVVKLKAKEKFPTGKFEIVSIGLEPEINTWQAYIRNKNLKWVQLVDNKIWNGTTQRTFKIDSIPFNFLLAPGGRILRKAIPADSVISVLSGYVK